MRTSLKINKNCVQCGSCLGYGYEFLISELDGTVKVKNGIFMDEKCDEYKSLKDICPVDAFELYSANDNLKQTFLSYFEKLKYYSAKRPRTNSFKFNKDEYSITIPSASGEYKYEYSSDSSANSAARSEFDRKMYAQIDVLILKIITEYRVKYLSPYYIKKEGYFEKCNNEVSTLLDVIANLLKEAGLANDLPADFSNISVYPEDDIVWKMLNKGEVMSDEMVSTIRREFNSSNYSLISSYESYWNTDDREVFAGTDWRGNYKYKDKYCYYNIRSAFQELAKDILQACYYKDTALEERAVELVGGIVDTYNKKLQSVLSSKIDYLEKKISYLPSEKGAESVRLETYENIVRAISCSEKDGMKVNGNLSNGNEVFVAEVKDGQIFFDGDVLKKKYISNAMICNKVILQERNFNYEKIWGWNGNIMFVTSDDVLWAYSCDNNTLKQIERNACRFDVYKEYLFYLYWSNMNNRFSPCRVCCCKLDGTGNKSLVQSWDGIIGVKEINDTELKYECWYGSKTSGSVKWR